MPKLTKLREKRSQMRHGNEKAQNTNLLLFTMKIKVLPLFSPLFTTPASWLADPWRPDPKLQAPRLPISAPIRHILQIIPPLFALLYAILFQHAGKLGLPRRIFFVPKNHAAANGQAERQVSAQLGDLPGGRFRGFDDSVRLR